MTKSNPKRSGGSPSSQHPLLEQILTEYIERLNRGEKIDPAEVIAAHPETAAEILLELETLEDLVRWTFQLFCLKVRIQATAVPYRRQHSNCTDKNLSDPRRYHSLDEIVVADDVVVAVIASDHHFVLDDCWMLLFVCCCC